MLAAHDANWAALQRASLDVLVQPSPGFAKLLKRSGQDLLTGYMPNKMDRTAQSESVFDDPRNPDDGLTHISRPVLFLWAEYPGEDLMKPITDPGGSVGMPANFAFGVCLNQLSEPIIEAINRLIQETGDP